MAAIAWAVFALAIVPHEAGHVLGGVLVGGDPTLLTTTEVKGEWSGVTDAGIVVLAVSGPAVNVLLAMLGVGLIRLCRGASPATRFFAWLFTAVNGFLPVVYMVFAPLMRFGDWDTALRRLRPELPLRFATIVLGAVLTVLWVFYVARALRPLLVGDSPAERRPYGLRLVWTALLSGVALSAFAAAFSPLPLLRSMFVAVGASFGCAWPMLPAVRVAADALPTGAATRPLGRSVAWIAAGLAIGLSMVLVFGPGVRV